MPVNLNPPDVLYPVAGVELAAVSAGLKKNGALDMTLVSLPEGSTSAAVFTRNVCCAAPVRVCRDYMQSNRGDVRALLVNSGGANAATGELGRQLAVDCCSHVASQLSIPVDSVLPFSTGVIGEHLPQQNMLDGIDSLTAKLSGDTASYEQAAQGILTTDLLPKLSSRQLVTESGAVNVTGFAKGSGMIAPDMATMLAYVFTDAEVSAADLDTLIQTIAARTFNSVTVDGDTSTNDSFVISATGKSGVTLTPGHSDWDAFVETLTAVSLELAQALVRDGEGATKFMAIHVSGGNSEQDCHRVGMTVANSPLVKTAFFASDANLGRIVMAVGRSGVDFAMEDLSLKIGDVAVLTNGEPDPGYTDEQGQAQMAADEITVSVDLGAGSASWTVWTCDFSYDYVKINAEYRS